MFVVRKRKHKQTQTKMTSDNHTTLGQVQDDGMEGTIDTPSMEQRMAVLETTVANQNQEIISLHNELYKNWTWSDLHCDLTKNSGFGSRDNNIDSPTTIMRILMILGFR